MKAEEVAALFDDRTGYLLVDYEEVGLPAYRLTTTVLTLQPKQYSAIDEFVIRAVDLGLGTVADLSGFLGVDERVIEATASGLIREDDLVERDGAVLTLTKKSQQIMAGDALVRPREQSLVFHYDGLTRRTINGADIRMLATYSPNSPSTVENMIATASDSIRFNAPNAWRPATTAAGIVLSLGEVLVFGIGDSRVYGIDKAGVAQLTVDHRSRTDSRAITRFLGGEHAQSIPDIRTLSTTIWLGFLICTDGFYAHLTTIELGIFRELDPKIALINLMDVALERGSTDIR